MTLSFILIIVFATWITARSYPELGDLLALFTLAMTISPLFGSYNPLPADHQSPVVFSADGDIHNL